MELVSIIMPCYNMQSYIIATVESVLSQTYSCWELLIADDCSTDKSVAIIQNLTKQDNRIKLIQLNQNSGVAQARNAALQYATGTYIAFLDSDDFWDSPKLELQIKFMKEKKAAFSFTSYRQITEDGAILRILSAPSSLGYQTLLKKNLIGCLTVMIDARKIKHFQMPVISHEDFAAWLTVLKKYEIKAYGLNIPLASYTIRQNSLSRNKIKSMLWVYKIYRMQEHMSFPKSLFYILRWFLKSI